MGRFFYVDFGFVFAFYPIFKMHPKAEYFYISVFLNAYSYIERVATVAVPERQYLPDRPANFAGLDRQHH